MSEILLRGEKVNLLPQRAVWWPKEKTLVVADLHWGKSAHFRKHGIAIPGGTQTQDEHRLAELLRTTGAERLMIAGDLFHSRSNNQVASFTHFRQQHSEVQFDLVIGNHDILKPEEYQAYNLTSHQQCATMGPFCIAHDMTVSDDFIIHGHIHPAIRIKSRGANQPSLKLCCFALQEQRMILPAFGAFTGTHVLDERVFQQLFVIAEGKVIRWK